MNERNNERRLFTAYEYKEVLVFPGQVSQYIDGFQCFGWVADGNPVAAYPDPRSKICLRFKRDRNIINRTELTRLQSHFEACMEEIAALDLSKKSAATAWSIAAGLTGAVCAAGVIRLFTAGDPDFFLCILLAFPALAGLIAALPVYRSLYKKRSAIVMPLIEAKYDELYAVCEKGTKLIDS